MSYTKHLPENGSWSNGVSVSFDKKPSTEKTTIPPNIAVKASAKQAMTVSLLKYGKEKSSKIYGCT